MRGVLIAALTVTGAFGRTSTQEIKLVPSDGAAGNNFGLTCCLDTSLALVGAPYGDGGASDTGAAYLFNSLSGQELIKLTASDGKPGNEFGSGVCISGNQLLVGARRAPSSSGGSWSGAAYLYDALTGTELLKLEPVTPNTQFGWSVSIDGGIALIGAPDDDTMATNSGAAYLFNTTSGQFLQKLTASDGDTTDMLGVSVSVSGNLALVGAPYAGQSGCAYVFDVSTGNQVTKLVAPDAASGSWLGWSVALDGAYALVGAHRDDENGPVSGSAYVFNALTGQVVQKLTASDGVKNDEFGRSVDISGNLGIIGAYPNAAAYVFDILSGVELTKLTPSDGAAGAFGFTVAIEESATLVGNYSDDGFGIDSGSAYLYKPLADCDGDGTSDSAEIAAGAPDCDLDGVPDECQIANDATLDWNGDGILDACTPPNYCTANPNTTGQAAVMSVSGSPIIADNNFTLTASQMPTFEWGYFLMAETQGFIPNVGGSGGNLCLGFPFYRFSKPPTGTILSSGSSGTFSFTPNLTNLPQGVVFMIGETWDFQAWYRDGAASTSNFTDGIEVMFR